MAHNTRTRANWSLGGAVTPAELTDLQRKVASSVNGDKGGAYAPSSRIEIGDPMGGGLNMAGGALLRVHGAGSKLKTVSNGRLELADNDWPQFSAQRTVVRAVPLVSPFGFGIYLGRGPEYPQASNAVGLVTIDATHATLTGLYGMEDPRRIKDDEIVLSGFGNGSNDGTFTIYEYLSATSVRVVRGGGTFVGTDTGIADWTIYLKSRWRWVPLDEGELVGGWQSRHPEDFAIFDLTPHLIDGCTMKSVTVRFHVGQLREAPPSVFPTLDVERVPADGSPIASLRADGAQPVAAGLTGAQWYADGGIQSFTFEPDQHNASLDLGAYSYRAKFTDEGYDGGFTDEKGTTLVSLSVEMLVSNLRFG